MFQEDALEYKCRRPLQPSFQIITGNSFVLVPNYLLTPTGSRHERGPKGRFIVFLSEGGSGMIVSSGL